jgi:hypothetical protein
MFDRYANRTFCWLCVISLACSSASIAQESDPDEPPIAGQPSTFNGAVGSFQIATFAQPTDVQAEDPIIFTIRITGTGSRKHPPQRPSLRRLPEFTRRFVIDDIINPATKTVEGIWEFQYRLKPVNDQVREIPGIRFDYYKPGIVPPEKGYRVRYSEAISLQVRPRKEVSPTEIQGGAEPTDVPDALYHLEEGQAVVLGSDVPFGSPGLLVLALFLLGPPALCGCWYACWRYCYPDAIRLARQRQSRAARKALHDLAAGTRHSHDDSAVTAVVVEYLRQRWGLPMIDPTPQQVAAHVHQKTAGEECTLLAAEFFRKCDAVRFAPGSSPNSAELTASAIELIQALEAQE